MANKKVFSALAIATTFVLSGCATTIVHGLSVEKTSGFEENRNAVVVEAQVLDAAGAHHKTGSVSFYQDQMPFSGYRVDLPAEETFYKLVAEDSKELSGHRLTVTVSAQNPEDTVSCAIKDTGIFEPVHSAHAEGKGSATCSIEMH